MPRHRQKNFRKETSVFRMDIQAIVIAAAYSKFVEGYISLSDIIDSLRSSAGVGKKIFINNWKIEYQITGEYSFYIAPVIIQSATNPVDVNEVLGNDTIGTVRAIIDSACVDSLVGYRDYPLKMSHLIGFTEYPDDEEKYLNAVKGTYKVPKDIINALNSEQDIGWQFGEYHIAFYGLTEASQDLKLKVYMTFDIQEVQDSVGLR